jgi:hypothetical protein
MQSIAESFLQQDAAQEAMQPVPLTQEYIDVVALATNPYQFLIALGRLRQGILPQTGSIKIQSVDWVRLVSVSPVTARVLAFLLEKSLEQYEQQFGKIPHDPLFDALKAAETKENESEGNSK